MYVVTRHGLTRRLYALVKKLRNKTCQAPHGLDSPGRCVLGTNYWYAYPIQNYNYVYNSWGFRGEDYEQYLGKEVNVCLGDSNTVNIGASIEDGWVHQLAQNFDIPTLNFGVDGVSFADLSVMLDKIKTNFKVKHTFFLYNLFENERNSQSDIITSVNFTNIDISTKIKAFKEYCFRRDVFWQFDPPWTFSSAELQCLYEYFPEAHDYLKAGVIDYRNIDYRSVVASDVLSKEYQKISGVSWVSYPQFVEKLMIDPANILELFPHPIDQTLIQEFVSKWMYRVLYTNRDGYHQSKYVNKLLADYFYLQTLKN